MTSVVSIAGNRVCIPLDKVNYNKVSKIANVLIFKEFYPKTKRCRITFNLGRKFLCLTPVGTKGFKSGICHPYTHRAVKGDWMRRFLEITVSKGWPRAGAWKGTLKNPTKCLWRLEPDRWSNFFFSLRAQLCAVAYTYMYNWNIVACDVKQHILLCHSPQHMVMS